MIKKNQRYLNLLNMILDILILFGCYMLSGFIRFYLMAADDPSIDFIWSRQYVFAAALYSVFTALLYLCAHLYSSKRIAGMKRTALTITSINLLSSVVLSAFLYMTRIASFSRIAIGIFFILSSLFVLSKHCLVFCLLKALRLKGYNQKHVVVVGDGELARQYVQSIKDNPQYGFHLLGYVSSIEKPELGRRLCSYEQLYDWLEKETVDNVVIALEPHECQYVSGAIEACEKQGVTASIIPFFSRYFPAQPTIDVMGESKLLNLCATPLNDMMNSAFKRLFDVLVSCLLLVVLSPVMALAAVGVKLTMSDSVIFKQDRIGRHKAKFTIYKFRSMRTNGKENTTWSTNTDPRKTKFGSFLRKFSIDELPQLVNVLKGDMSLIGPRPEIPYFVEQFKEIIPHYMLKHQVRPGITGWAQVNGYRGDTSIQKRIEYDLWYIQNWSFALDIKILFLTAFGGIVNQENLAAADDENHAA